MQNDAIKYLKDQLKVKQDEREAQRARDKVQEDRLRAIKEAAPVKEDDFWCHECSTDFVGLGYKKVNWVFDFDLGYAVAPLNWKAWYEARCDKNHLCIRRITDKTFDPYYVSSRWIQRQQKEHADDFLTPDDPRFRLKYPEQWARLQAQYGEPTGTTN